MVVLKIFKKLFNHYGPRHWWPAKTRFEVIVGAVLAQNVSWKNAKKAIDHLKDAGLLSPEALSSCRHQKIAHQIKSSRFYNQKAKKLKALCSWMMQTYDGSLNKMFRQQTEDLREQLLGIKGIGQETADCILLYAAGKPSFVSDAYTQRFFERYGVFHGRKTYEEIRNFFMHHLPRDIYLYNEYHALIDHHSSHVCQSRPDCDRCPVRIIDRNTRCHYAQRHGLGALNSTMG